jgi:hypothetical protein
VSNASLVARPTSADLSICAKHLLAEANDERVTQHGPLPWRASRVGGKSWSECLSTKAKVEDRKSVTSSAQPTEQKYPVLLEYAKARLERIKQGAAKSLLELETVAVDWPRPRRPGLSRGMC